MPDRRQSTEILIIGAGPAGIAAACTAAESGKQVTLIDNNPTPGGNIWRGGIKKFKTGSPGHWLTRLAQSKARLISESTLFAASAKNNTVDIETPEGLLEIQYVKLILAVGARELFLPFPGWTLPNVFGVGGLQALVKGGWPIQNKRVIVAGSGPLVLACAAQLRDEGAKLLAVAEQAPFSNLLKFAMTLPATAPSKIFQAIALRSKLLGVSFRTGWWAAEAHGKNHLEAVTLTNGHKTQRLDCDYLACAYSLIPNLELPAMLGCKIENQIVITNDDQLTSVPNIYCAGEPRGIGGVDTSLLEGQIAGYAATGQSEKARHLHPAAHRAAKFRAALRTAFALRPELKSLAKPDTIICRCEDVTRARLESHPTWRSAKLHTRCGMGPCQGRVCGAAIQHLFNWESASIRPPILPVSVDALAHAAESQP